MSLAGHVPAVKPTAQRVAFPLVSSQARLRLTGTLALATAMALAVRLVPAFYSNFPVHDGGLFYAMIRDLQANGYRLPVTTSYNDIPFAYPPLTFYLVGALSGITHTDPLVWMRFLPAVVSAATVPAFYPVARRLSRDHTTALFAVFFFALLPNTWDSWAVGGGGLTRSFGFFFAILAIHQALRLYQGGERRAAIPLAVFMALSVLSHPLTALFVVTSVPILFVVYSREPRLVITSVAAGLLAAALTSPWWLTVVSRDGLGPFISAMQTGGNSSASWIVALVTFKFINEPLFPLLSVLCVAGIASALARRQRFLPAWLVLMFVLHPRLAFHSSAIPVAVLAAEATTGLLVPFLRGELGRAGASADGWFASKRARLGVYALIGYALLGAFALPLAPQSSLRTITPDARQAMAWIAANTAPDAQFAVVTSEKEWGADQLSEWFPALAERPSVATVQGYEWMGIDAAVRQTESYAALQKCGAEDTTCLAAWEQHYGQSPAYIVVAKAPYTGPGQSSTDEDGMTAALRLSLKDARGYAWAFENDAVVVYRVSG